MTRRQSIRTSEARAGSPHRGTILLVEDDLLIGGTLTTALRSAGYRVRAARTGLEARAAVPRVRPDLVILDLMLPDTDGLVLAMQLKHLTRAPLIVCSARHGQVDRALARRLGILDFIAKPFDLEDLEARIQAALRSHAQETRTAATEHPPDVS
jgi:DNA-binding response OmpR family regulator